MKVIGVGKEGVGFWAQVMWNKKGDYPNINKPEIIRALETKGFYQEEGSVSYFQVFDSFHAYKKALKGGK
ncbi:hypothetical protein NVP1101O_187 [Vibrio phage 1.101.O._10N.261.45.C6]|nr:hypothetical protein NVP1101O_187 [Vibrio phage 1.101.O._10N.261.45.C6]